MELNGLLFGWIFFSVVLGLFHLIVGFIIWLFKKQHFRFYELIKDGSLIFFAVPLTASAYVETHFVEDCFQDSTFAQMGVTSFVIIIVLLGTALYSLIIHENLNSKNRQVDQGVVSTETIDFSTVSWIFAGVCTIFSIVLTYIRLA